MGKEYRKQVEVMSTVSIPNLALIEDDFAATLFKWDSKGTTGSVTDRDATIAYNGEASLRSKTRATGSVDGDEAYGLRYVQLTDRRFFNLSFVVKNKKIVTRAGTLYIRIEFLDSLGWGVFGLKLDDLNHKLYYYDSGGSWTELSGYTLVGMNDIYYRIEIQVNRLNRKIKYVKIGESQPDLEDVSFYNNSGVTGSSYINLVLGVIQNDGANESSAQANYDDVVLMTPDQ